MSILELTKSKSDETIVQKMYSCYPVRLMQQAHWAPYVSIVGLGFGGGLVQGDCTSLSISLLKGAEFW